MTINLGVSITGKPGAGKTTLAAMLTEFLQTRGFYVECDDPDLDSKSIGSHLKAVQTLKNSANIRISTSDG
jgi:CO dehydrogenase nickel-insertion accessory protein CooC1